MIFKTIGWIGAILLFICGFPITYEAIKTGRSETFKTTMGQLFLWMWFLGETLTLIYVISFKYVKMPLIVMGLLNSVQIAIILKYLYFPRGSK